MLIHIVAAHDTLYALARRYGISVARLISDNGLRYPYPLVLGQALLITRPSATHTVRAGESLYRIAQEAGISIQELYQYNPVLTDGLPLYVGQELTLGFAREKIRAISTNGYAYPFINYHVLRRTLPYLTYLSVFSYGFRADASLVIPDDAGLLREARAFQALPVMVVSSIDDTGNFSGAMTEKLLQDQDFQDLVLDRLIATMLERGYRGLDSDFEYIPPELARAYVRFLENAGQKLRAEGLFLHSAVAPKTSADQPGLLYEGHLYSEIGKASERVLVMTYEWGYTRSPPQAVAPLPQVSRVLRYAVSEIPPEKILMGMPNYGYVWTLPHVPGRSKAMSIGNEEAVRIAARQGADILYDERAQTPHFSYRYETIAHEVYFEDVRSIEAKCALADALSLSGFGYWNIMRPFAQNWLLLAIRYQINKYG